MELYYYIIIILIVSASVADAIMDTIQFRLSSSRLPQNRWWNPQFSWYMKWKMTNEGCIIPNTKRPWYYLGLYKPTFVEKFMWSSTILVFTTDAWHMGKSLKLNAIFLAITLALDLVVIESILAFIVLRVVYGLIFELLFSWWLRK